VRRSKPHGKGRRARSAQSKRTVGRDATSALANPFLMMRVVSSLRAFILPVADLENLLADGRSVISPVSLDDVIAGIRHDSAIELLKDLRRAMVWTSGESEQAAAESVCQIAFRLVERLNRLAERGALGDAPRRIRAWPIDFAPGASEGASKMKDEVALFEALGVGSDALVTASPRSRAGIGKKGKGGWRAETEAALEASMLNAQWFLPLHKLRHESKPLATVEYYHPQMKKRLQVHGFKTPGRRVLLWPWWMDDVLELTHNNPATGLPFLERLDATSVDLFMPVVTGLIYWRVIFGKAARTMQLKVVASDEGGDVELTRFQPELMGKVLTGVRHTLLALAGRGRRGKNPEKGL
jgi:hypothetical protein